MTTHSRVMRSRHGTRTRALRYVYEDTEGFVNANECNCSTHPATSQQRSNPISAQIVGVLGVAALSLGHLLPAAARKSHLRS